MESARRRSRYDPYRVPHFAEDLMINPTQSPFGSLPNSDLARSSNGVDLSTYSNTQLLIHEEPAMMNSSQPLAYGNQRDFDCSRTYNSQQECINWPTTYPTELSRIDHSNTQNACFAKQERERALLPTYEANSSRGSSLSLSLSSNPSSNVQNMKKHNLGFHKHFDSVTKHGGKESGKALQDVMGISTFSAQWSSGPLGPFTGYATILKSSKFLKPAQDLLDDICDFPGVEPIEMRVLLQRIAEESGGDGGWSSLSNSLASEHQQKKAALVYMYDEVCGRYKHYYQQMQMVVSSFEAVAGLSAATPYVYLALKAVIRNFECLRNAISEHLRSAKRSLVNDNVLSHQIDTSQLNQSLQRRRSCLGVNTSFFETQSHGWRPQRGLPERSVAVLRAWLFEHFLHPYPTDHDKHMLATKTGLSRNQVSNWFINARVRLWKPMVEEIHELETKCIPGGCPVNANSSEKHRIHDILNLRETYPPPRNPNLPTVSPADEQVMLSGDPRDKPWDSGIRSRLECHQAPINIMEGSMIEFARYPQSGSEFGSLGSISLSLGLRHNVGVSQQLLQQQQQHFGDEMI